MGVRVPNTESDEDFALRLIERDGVVAHPGYFFDFETDGYLVISLLTEPRIFDEGIRRPKSFARGPTRKR